MMPAPTVRRNAGTPSGRSNARRRSARDILALVLVLATTAARADLVAWLDGGRIRALAPHRELWADREYRAIFGAADGAGEAC